MPSPPTSPDDYIVWASDQLGHEYGSRTSRWYASATTAFVSEIEAGPFWQGIPEALARVQQEYRGRTGFDLFPGTGLPELKWDVKPFTSVVDKLFRKNVVWNKKWPDPPRGGWFNPEDCLSGLDDTVRTRLTCSYLDGPELVVNELNSLAKSLGIDSIHDSRELDAGYYAYHLYLNFEIDSFDSSFNESRGSATAEIQVVTRLQDLMNDLTHPFYEETRLQRSPDRKAWKWDHQSPRFRSAFLGHTLHLLEAVVLDVRDGIRDAAAAPAAAAQDGSSSEETGDAEVTPSAQSSDPQAGAEALSSPSIGVQGQELPSDDGSRDLET